MTTEEKQMIMALLETIASLVNVWTDITSIRMRNLINEALRQYPVISCEMGADLKIREE